MAACDWKMGGAEVDVQIGDGPRGPTIQEVVAVDTTPETRELHGVLAIWGNGPQALCFATEPIRVPFDRGAWHGAEPEYGQTVRCVQAITTSIVEPQGWGHTKAVAVEPAKIPAKIARTLRAALVGVGDETSFPGYRRGQRVKLVMPASRSPAWNQYEDWPVCSCGARTKFLGYPDNGATLDDFVRQGARFYENGVTSDRAACPLTAASGKTWEPEEWSEVSCFRCKSCDARYFTFQNT